MRSSFESLDFDAYLVEAILTISKISAEEILMEVEPEHRIYFGVSLILLNRFQEGLCEIQLALSETAISQKHLLLENISIICKRLAMNKLSEFFGGECTKAQHYYKHHCLSHEERNTCERCQSFSETPITVSCANLCNFRLVDSKDILITFWKCVEFLETTANFRFLESFQDRIKNWKNIIDDLREMRGRYLDNSVISFMEYCISMRLTSPLPILPRNPFTLPEMQWLIKAFEHASPYALTSSLEEYVKEVIMSTPNSSETKDQVKNYHLFHTMMGIISLDKNDLESAKSHLTIAVALVDMLKCALDYAVLEDIRLDYVLMRPENTNCIYILLIQCYLREWKETELELLQSQGTDLRDITKPVLVLKLSDTSKLYHRQSTLKARATFSEVLAFRSRRVRIMPTGEKWFRLEKNHILDATTDYILLSATNYNDDPHNSKLYDKIVWSLLMCGDIHVDTILFFDFLRFYFSLNKACQPVGEKFIQSIDESFMTTKIEQIIASLRYLRNSSLHIKSDDTNLDYPWNWWLISPCLLGNNPENVVFEDCLPASAKWYKIHDSNTGVMSRTITNKIRGILKHETGEIKQRENLRLSFHLVDLWKENYTGYHQGALPSKIEEYLEHHYGLRDIV